ncbi:MAG TPA: glycosyltransferase [Xanthomonadales bacterium]|nr:glycosyltransferase [Xanthomonadales bacterium]
MSALPLVSTIIPCYNGGAFLADAVSSIRRQKHAAVEIIVIDDGSTDDSAAVAAKLAGPDLHYFRQENQGLPSARNAGLERARGEIIAFLDVDDLWHDNTLEIQLSLLNAHLEIDIVIGYSQKMHITGHENGKPVFEPWFEPAPLLSLCCAAVRRTVFDTVGGFDQTQRYCDDWDWYMRARELGVAIKIHEAVVHYYRRHESNMTNNVEIGNKHTLQMLKKSLDRRRRQQGGQASSLANLLNKDD